MKFYSSYLDCKLTTLLSRGDEAAFTEIYSRYSEKLLAIAYQYTKDKNFAEEIVQEVFSGLWERRSQLKIETLSAYLATAIKFSVFRTVHRQRRRAEIVELNYKVKEADLLEETIHAKFLQEYINGIVEQLPEKCRLVYKYSRNKGLSNAEISEEMEIAEKTVEAHMTKALKALRNNLKELGVSIYLLLSFL
jgi:RNA polymerase sigma-70 factor (ECF subfamily)